MTPWILFSLIKLVQYEGAGEGYEPVEGWDEGGWEGVGVLQRATGPFGRQVQTFFISEVYCYTFTLPTHHTYLSYWPTCLYLTAYLHPAKYPTTCLPIYLVPTYLLP